MAHPHSSCFICLQVNYIRMHYDDTLGKNSDWGEEGPPPTQACRNWEGGEGAWGIVHTIFQRHTIFNMPNFSVPPIPHTNCPSFRIWNGFLLAWYMYLDARLEWGVEIWNSKISHVSHNEFLLPHSTCSKHGLGKIAPHTPQQASPSPFRPTHIPTGLQNLAFPVHRLCLFSYYDYILKALKIFSSKTNGQILK